MTLSDIGCMTLPDNQFSTLFLTADAGLSPSDSGCRRNSMRQRMHEALYQIANVGVSISDSGSGIHSITQRMQRTLFQIADEGVPLSDNGFRRHSMTKDAGLYQTAYTGDMLSNSRCRSLFIKQRIQETFIQTADQETLYDTADSGLSLFDSGCR